MNSFLNAQPGGGELAVGLVDSLDANATYSVRLTNNDAKGNILMVDSVVIANSHVRLLSHGSGNHFLHIENRGKTMNISIVNFTWGRLYFLEIFFIEGNYEIVVPSSKAELSKSKVEKYRSYWDITPQKWIKKG